MKVIKLDQIKSALPSIDLLSAIETGFIAYSQGKAVIPPVGELLFDDPPGDVHIKYGYLLGGEYYVIKIASGFYENPQLGLPSSNGMMLMFSQRTGEPECVLLDNGYLTDLRTAAAGAVVARALAPSHVERIGIIGTGTQAQLQLSLLADVLDCREVAVMGRTTANLVKYQELMEAKGFRVETTTDIEMIGATCNLIITTTPSTEPLLLSRIVQKGTHITAVGSDTPEKQELEAAVLGMADVIVADSISQCLVRGEIFHAVKSGVVPEDVLVELGQVLTGSAPGRTNDDQITVADLTGVAVQDIQIATAVYATCSER